MRIITTKEERKQIIEHVMNAGKGNIMNDFCNPFEHAETIIEYTFRTNDGIAELLTIINKTDFSAVKEFHCWYVIIRSPLTHEISMKDIDNITGSFRDVCDDTISFVWEAACDENLDCNLKVVALAFK